MASKLKAEHQDFAATPKAVEAAILKALASAEKNKRSSSDDLVKFLKEFDDENDDEAKS